MRLAIALLLCSILLGCTTYYKVRDPDSGSVYYTTEIDKQRGGAISLTDDRTNAQVTIQNSEVLEITDDEYDAAIRTVEVAPPAPPASAPAESTSDDANSQ